MNKRRRWLYLLAGGVGLIAGTVTVARQVRGPTEQSATSGPLRYAVRTSQDRYALGRGETVTVEATLTNIGGAPLPVFRPSPYSDRLWLDEGGDILARNYSNVSMAGPSARDIVLLTPGRSVTTRHSLFSRTVHPFLTVRRHTLRGEYDTPRLLVGGLGPVPRFWRGRIKTAPLVFAITDGHREVSAAPPGPSRTMGAR